MFGSRSVKKITDIFFFLSVDSVDSATRDPQLKFWKYCLGFVQNSFQLHPLEIRVSFAGCKKNKTQLSLSKCFYPRRIRAGCCMKCTASFAAETFAEQVIRHYNFETLGTCAEWRYAALALDIVFPALLMHWKHDWGFPNRWEWRLLHRQIEQVQ